MAELVLSGCAPAPLAAYLKAMGVLRLVARQADPEARGRWSGDAFVLGCALDAAGLEAFFLDRCAPTPAVSPWNGGSGFHPKDYRAALERIEASGAPRLAPFRAAIAAAREALALTGAGSEAKAALVSRCRATFPDAALEWLDAALVLTPDGLRYPPLLVSGGNDGRLDFSNNCMQRLADVLPELGAARAESAGWLRAALFGEPSPPLRQAAIGMFSPGAAGGANATAGFEGESLVNPWDFVLMIEGVVLFAGAAARRLSRGEGAAARAAFPFAVEPSTAGVRLGASESERPRAEVWLPLWAAPSSLAEVEHLCAEGRVEWRRRQARDAVEFSEAVAALGVARGVDAFERYSVCRRMGRSHVATPVGRVAVRARPEADLLAGVDWWLRRFRERVGQDAPAGLRERRRRLERAVFDLALHGGPAATLAVLAELGQAELAVSVSGLEGLAELPPLELDARWLDRCDDGSPELRLAAALGSVGAGTAMPVRASLEPVAREGARLVRLPARSRAWDAGPAAGRLAAVLRRRLLDARTAGDPDLALTAPRAAGLGDVAALVTGAASAGRVAELLAGLSLVRWPAAPGGPAGPAASAPAIPRAYALLKLCFLPFPIDLRGAERRVPPEPGIAAALAAGDVPEALRRAAGRLRGSGLPLHRAAASPELARGLDGERLLASLLVPISRPAASALAALVSIPHESEVPL